MGTILRLVLWYELHAMARFPSVQDVVSSCRLVTGANASAGHRDGTAGTTMGHADRTGAVADAAVLVLRDYPAGPKDLARLEPKHGQGQALTVLAHKLARAGSDLLQRGGCSSWTQFALATGAEQASLRPHWGTMASAGRPCSATVDAVRRRTPMSPSALDPDPVRVLGRLLRLLSSWRE